MLVPELKSLTSPDLKRDELPKDPGCCCVLVEVEISPKGIDGGDIFSFVVATPNMLDVTDRWQWGRGYLILGTFSWGLVERAVQSLLSHASGESWKELTDKLSKELNWEFENFGSENKV